MELPTQTQLELKAVREYQLPTYMVGSLSMYILEGKPVGHFLTAILSNDLKTACNRADSTNARLIYQYVKFLFNNAPLACWGSPENVAKWRQVGGFKGYVAEMDKAHR